METEKSSNLDGCEGSKSSTGCANDNQVPEAPPQSLCEAHLENTVSQEPEGAATPSLADRTSSSDVSGQQQQQQQQQQLPADDLRKPNPNFLRARASVARLKGRCNNCHVADKQQQTDDGGGGGDKAAATSEGQKPGGGQGQVYTHQIKHDQSWTVTNFSRKMKMNVGKNIESIGFSIPVLGKKTDWCLMLYPNGDKEKVKGLLSLYLTCRNRRNLDLALEFKFHVQDLVSNKNISPVKSGVISPEMLAKSKSWGWGNFISHRRLLEEKVLLCDRLTIDCQITLKFNAPEEREKAVELPLEDDRDIDQLVDFVGELTDKKTKKKSKKKGQKKVDVSLCQSLSEDEAEEEGEGDRIIVISSHESHVTEKLSNRLEKGGGGGGDKENSESCGDFQVVTRKRTRRTSQSSSVVGKGGERTADSGKRGGGSKRSAKLTAKSTNSTKHATSPIEAKVAATTEKVQDAIVVDAREPSVSPDGPSVVRKAGDTSDSFTDFFINNHNFDQVEITEQIEDLLSTKILLINNIERVKVLQSNKVAHLDKISTDKKAKLADIAVAKQTLVNKRQEISNKRRALEDEQEQVETLLRKITEKTSRLTTFMEGHQRDAEAQLDRLGEERDRLEDRLNEVELKLGGGRSRLVSINNQIERLQNNLECPICMETASTPIFQCTEGHLVCSGCEGRVSVCAICRKPGQRKGIRNRYAEKDSEELQRLIIERKHHLLTAF